MKPYYYVCTICNTKFSPEEIEKKFICLCPTCGKAEKNQPLEGVLTVEYDYSELKKKFARNKFLKLIPGKFWLYPDLWPLNFQNFSEDQLNKLSLPEDQLKRFEIEGRELWIMDETRNPTFSYKDRASSVVVLKALEMGISEIAAASTGNAGSSLAGICQRLGIRARIYVPKNIPDAKRKQIEAYGPKLELVDGDYDKAFDVCLEESKNNKWYNRNTAYNPLTIEGKKSAAYDIFISSKGNIPDVILVPVGDGVIISGIYKGFKELLILGWIEKLPKLIAVQAAGSDGLVRYLQSGKFEYKPAETIADSISAGAPRNLYMAAGTVKESDGIAITVSDDEMITAQNDFKKETGILPEISSVSVYAAYKKLLSVDKLNSSDKHMLLITGNGLKDIIFLK